MKLGCRAHDMGRTTEEELPNRVREAGFEAVQLALTKAITGIESFRDITPKRTDRICRAFDDAGVEISILGCYVEIGLSDREERLLQVAHFLEDGLENAKRMGVPVVGTETSWFDREYGPGADREVAYQNLKDSVLRMVDRAEKLDVVIGIEPVTVHVLNSARLARRLLDEVGSDRLKVIFDPVNMVAVEDVDRQEEIFGEFQDLLGKDIRILHAKDMAVKNGEKVWRNIGQGVIRQDMVFDWLKENMPEVPVLREEVVPESAAEDLAALRELVRR